MSEQFVQMEELARSEELVASTVESPCFRGSFLPSSII